MTYIERKRIRKRREMPVLDFSATTRAMISMTLDFQGRPMPA